MAQQLGGLARVTRHLPASAVSSCRTPPSRALLCPASASSGPRPPHAPRASFLDTSSSLPSQLLGAEQHAPDGLRKPCKIGDQRQQQRAWRAHPTGRSKGSRGPARACNAALWGGTCPSQRHSFSLNSPERRGAAPAAADASLVAKAASASAAGAPFPDSAGPAPTASAAAAVPAKVSRRNSDVVWPTLGSFLCFCGLAAADKLLAPHRLSATLASFAAVTVVLFATPQVPSAQRKRVLLAHFGAGVIGVGVMLLLGPTWLARSLGVALSVGFMLLADCVHPPAAGLPVIFVDGPKWHGLGWCYSLFPGVIGCVWLFALQEMVLFLKEKVQF